MEKNFIEKRRYYRLPFSEPLLVTDGKKTVVGEALNISRGGVFLKTLNPLPLDAIGYLALVLPGSNESICLKSKVAHLVFDRQRAEVDCGMGLQFVEISTLHQNQLDEFINQEKESYLSLEKILKERRPIVSDIEKHLVRLPHLRGLELSALRYRVFRICTIFENPYSEDLSKTGRV